MEKTDYPPTSHFIQKCRDYQGITRLKHISRNLKVPLKVLYSHEKEITVILQFIKNIDNKYHDLVGWENYENDIFFDVTLHNHIASDIRSLLILILNNQNYQANIVLRHLIECIIITLWADLISRFTGAFNYLLDDTKEWKPYRTTQRITWDNSDVKNRNKSIKERLEKICLNNNSNMSKNMFYNEYFSKANDCDFRLLFSLPICKDCMKDPNKKINYEEFHLELEVANTGKEDLHATYKTNFGHTCNFCNKTKETFGYANGIPELGDMRLMLKAIISDRRISNLDILHTVYNFLSNEFVHFSATRHPDANPPPLCYIKNLNMNKKIWGLNGIIFCLKTMLPLFNLFFQQLQKTQNKETVNIIESKIDEKTKKKKIDEAICPSCHKIAKGKQEVVRLFGLRTSGGDVTRQSYCKDCRRKA